MAGRGLLEELNAQTPRTSTGSAENHPYLMSKLKKLWGWHEATEALSPEPPPAKARPVTIVNATAAAKYLGVTESQFLAWCDSQTPPPSRMLGDRRLFVLAELDRWEKEMSR